MSGVASSAEGAPARRMTDEEWASLPEDVPGELVDGVIVEEEVPDWIHEGVVTWLLDVLRGWLISRGGFVGGSAIKYLLRRGKGRKPDLSVFLPGTKPPPRRGPTRRPADLMVEVISPSPKDVRRDRLEKMAEYATFGVRWYWIVDPDARTFEIHELGPDGCYRWVLGASTGRVESVHGCEGLVLDLDELWAELDRLGPPEETETGEEE